VRISHDRNPRRSGGAVGPQSRHCAAYGWTTVANRLVRPLCHWLAEIRLVGAHVYSSDSSTQPTAPELNNETFQPTRTIALWRDAFSDHKKFASATRYRVHIQLGLRSEEEFTATVGEMEVATIRVRRPSRFMSSHECWLLCHALLSVHMKN